jgi:glycerophosphoryl diester phosphodiesterase
MELRRGGGRALRIRHRANALAAVESAAADGLDAVELDVLRAADGTVVLAHGPDVPDAAVPLEEGLALAAGLGLLVQLDAKVPGLADEAVAALERHGLLDRAFVSSFSLPILAGFAARAPDLPRAFTYPEDRYGLSGRRALRPAVACGLAGLRAALPRRLPRLLEAAGAAAATLNAAVVSPRAVDVCHELGAAVYVWTVNDAKTARTLVETGADGIIGDDPGILLSW